MALGAESRAPTSGNLLTQANRARDERTEHSVTVDLAVGTFLMHG